MNNNDFLNNEISEEYIDDWEDWAEIEEEEIEYEQISKEDFYWTIRDAKIVMKTFVEEIFGEEQFKKIEDIMNKVHCELDKSTDLPEHIAGYFDGENVYISNSYANKSQFSHQLINVIIHEYAHAFSRLIIKDEIIHYGLNDFDSDINPVVEEAFANLFAEMAINNYYKKDRQLSTVFADNDKVLNENGNDGSYLEEGYFLKTIMHFLQKENKDLSAIENYFFKSKGEFCDICISTLGEDIWNSFTRLRNVRNGLGEENNTDKYLPQELLNLINNIESNIKFDEKDYEKGNENALYNIQNPILDYIIFLRSNNFSELSVNELDMITEKANGKIKEIFSNYGCNDSLKKYILKCLKESKNNSDAISKIIELTGGIPFDVVKSISEERDIYYILDTYIKCNTLSFDSNYKDAIIFLQEKISKELGETQNNVINNKDLISDWTTISNFTLSYILKKKASNEQIKEILDFYTSNPKLADMNNVLMIIDELGNDELDDIEYNGLARLVYDIGDELESLNEVKDLQLLKDISSHTVVDEKKIETYLRHNTTLVQKIENDTFEAIKCFEKYGYYIENSNEIIENIRQCNYKNLEIKPNLDISLLKQIQEEDIDKISILINMSIEQFLSKEDLALKIGTKDYNDILFLTDLDIQDKFKMEDYSREAILNKIKNNMSQSRDIDEITRKDINRHIEQNKTYLKNRNNIKTYIKNTEELYLISEPMAEYLSNKKLTDEELGDLITFFEEDKLHFRNSKIEYNLETINKVAKLVKHSDIDIDYPNNCQEGEKQFIYKLIHATSLTSLNEENKRFLYEIYIKLKTINGLEIEEFDESFLETLNVRDEEVNVQENDVLQSGVIAAERVRMSSIKNNSEILVDAVKELSNEEEKDILKNTRY